MTTQRARQKVVLKDASPISIRDTNDPGEARALMNTKYTQHRMRSIKGDAKFAFKHISAPVPEGSFNILSYGSAVEIKPEPFNDFFMLEVPLNGGVTLEPEHGETISSCAEQALLIGPKLRFRSTWQEGCVQLMLKINSEQLHRRWQSVTNDELAVLPPLLPQVDLTSPSGWRIKQLMLLLQQELARSASNQQDLLGNSTLGGAITDAVLAYILCHRSDELSDSEATVLPAPLKQCVDFINNHLNENLSTMVLVNVAGTSERTLFNLFRQFLGSSPGTYIRNQRLKSSRKLLLNNNVTVAEAARLSSFNHMGRFASQYKTLFGESPSSTFKR